MRAWLAALVFSMIATAAHADMFHCERPQADQLYCRDGKRRPVCSQGGYLVWTDSRAAISQSEFAYLVADGPLPTPACDQQFRTPAQ
jgi:hypothetical protein